MCKANQRPNTSLQPSNRVISSPVSTRAPRHLVGAGAGLVMAARAARPLAWPRTTTNAKLQRLQQLGRPRPLSCSPGGELAQGWPGSGATPPVHVHARHQERNLVLSASRRYARRRQTMVCVQPQASLVQIPPVGSAQQPPGSPPHCAPARSVAPPPRARAPRPARCRRVGSSARALAARR